MKLTHHLLAHLAGWTLACIALAALYALHATRAEQRQAGESLAEGAVRVLDLQLARVALGADADSHFPDWALVTGLRVPAGACVRLVRNDGSVWRSSCRGADLARSAPAPGWFDHLYAIWPGAPGPIERVLRSPASAPAGIEVTTEARELAALAWRALRATTLLVVIVAGALGLVAFVVVARALGPARALLARIDAIESGDLTRRGTPLRFVEFQRIASALDRLATSLGAALQQQQRLARELIDAQEDERRRLARELHDEFGQGLAGIAALTGAVRRDLGAGHVPDSADLERIVTAAGAMQGQLRAMLAQLGPAALEDLGLGPALSSLIAEWEARCRGRPAFVFVGAEELPGQLPPALAITAYRITQEALTNATRHAAATRVELRVSVVTDQGQSWLALDITDDGAASPATLVPGHGLTGMRERALALRGEIEYGPQPQGGFRVLAILPLGQSREG